MHEARAALALLHRAHQRPRVEPRVGVRDQHEVAIVDAGQLGTEEREAKRQGLHGCGRSLVNAAQESKDPVELVQRHHAGYRAIRPMPDGTILVTGGTGALGSAVVAAFLDVGWRVAVTWVDPKELERVTEREGLVLIEADLFGRGGS